jgi:hypothetical protein
MPTVAAVLEFSARRAPIVTKVVRRLNSSMVTLKVSGFRHALDSGH